MWALFSHEILQAGAVKGLMVRVVPERRGAFFALLFN